MPGTSSFLVFVLNLTTTIYRAMSRDEEKYPDPDEFRPERFFTPDGSLSSGSILNDPVFGFGRRICEHFRQKTMNNLVDLGQVQDGLLQNP